MVNPDSQNIDRESALPEDAGISILLVDDEVNITRALRRLLDECGQYRVLTAQSGAEGLQLLAAEPDIGVIISDQRMPQMTGVEFLARARQQKPDAVRILLTGYADIEASIAAINQGAVFRFLTKPWEDEDLLRVVVEAARNYWLVAENKRLNALVVKQNAELSEWNLRLKQRVLEQTAQIRAKNDQLAENNLRLRRSFSGTIESLAGLIEMRDRRAPGHSRNVAELVSAMAELLELPEAERDSIRSAALLHDIGKIGIPDRLLAKPLRELDAVECRVYQNHAVRGQTAISMVPGLADIGPLIRHHHEQYNGQGFPDRIKGRNIPLGARLIAAANLFERQLIQHPASEALEAAIEDLGRHWGKALDPGLRLTLEESARMVFSHLDISAEILEIKVAPKELQVGMQLGQDLYSGTGVLLLKRGTTFDTAAIDAVQKCFLIDPFERELSVLVPRPAEEQ